MQLPLPARYNPPTPSALPHQPPNTITTLHPHQPGTTVMRLGYVALHWDCASAAPAVFRQAQELRAGVYDGAVWQPRVSQHEGLLDAHQRLQQAAGQGARRLRVACERQQYNISL